jgi:hypothetical protein
MIVAKRERVGLLTHFLRFCNYFRTVLVCFESVVGKFTPFSFLGSSTLSSFLIKSENDQYFLQPFPYLIKKRERER